MLNNQVDVLHQKLNHLEKYLSEQSELRQKAENRLQEVNFLFSFYLHCSNVKMVIINNISSQELIVKSKLETEKLEVIAMLTNLKLINIKLTKENMELREILINNHSTQNTITSPCKSDILVSKTINTFDKKQIYHQNLFI